MLAQFYPDSYKLECNSLQICPFTWRFFWSDYLEKLQAPGNQEKMLLYGEKFVAIRISPFCQGSSLCIRKGTIALITGITSRWGSKIPSMKTFLPCFSWILLPYTSFYVFQLKTISNLNSKLFLLTFFAVYLLCMHGVSTWLVYCLVFSC